MTSSGNTWTRVAGPMATTVRPRKYAVGWYRLASWLFGHGTVCETVATRFHFDASPAAVWNHIMFYEEVPGRPPFLLRALLPRPVRTDGNKTRVGAIVRCTYREGDLLKRITSLEPPHFLGFAVIEQSLGIEDCVLTLRGSYEIFACGNASDVVLITNYQAHLRPRYLWRSSRSIPGEPAPHAHPPRRPRRTYSCKSRQAACRCRLLRTAAQRASRRSSMHSIAIVFPPLVVIRASVAAVWLYEGLWCKILGRMQSQVEVVTAVPGLGQRFGRPFLKGLGIVEVALAVWVMAGIAPGVCAILQTALLMVLNANGLLWARHIIHDPAGMVVKNIAFLVLVWVCGAISGG